MPLAISLLGPLTVEIDGATLEVDTRKASALLAYLAIERVDQPRDRLVDLLWSDSDVDKGRSSLRRTLSTLRTGLDGRWIDADRSFIRIDTDDVDLDVDRVDRLLGPHERHPRGEVCATCVDDLRAAVALHRGPFLDGFSIRGAPGFELWVATRAEESSQRLDGALARLAAAHATGGDYEAASSATERRLDVDPLREDAYRQLMLYRAWAGDRSGAVDVYRRAVGVLDSELGVPPLDETTELYEAILEEDLPRAPAPPRPATTMVDAPAIPFVGRDAELAAALEALEAPGSLVVVEGMAGVGVSRLLDEVVERLRARATPLVALASDSERANPYGVVNQALFDVVSADAMRPAIERLPDSVRAEVSRIFPDLGSPPADSNSTRFMDAITRLVSAIPNPLLVIDDLDRADPASLAVVAFLAARAKRVGLRLLIGVDRAPEEGIPDGVEEFRSHATVIALEPLGPAAVSEFARIAGRDADELLDETGGLPLYLVESTRAAQEGKTLATRRLADRLGAIDGVARQVYEVLAILGRASDPAAIGSVAGRSPDEIDEAIDLLVSRGLVTEEASGTVRPAHGLMAKTAEDQLSAARRRLLNRRAAAVLESRGDEPGRIARHHALAGDDTAAADWHVRAGVAAADSFAHHEALEHLEAALAAGHPDRAMLRRRMGHAALLAGRYERAISEYEAALAAGDADVTQIEHRLGEIMRRLGRWDLAAAHYERALDSDPSPELEGVLEADRAYVEFRRAGTGAARPLVDRALALAERVGDGRAIARSRNVAGLIASDPAERRSHLEAALDLADDPAERVAVLNNLARVSDGNTAVDRANEGLTLATTIGDRHLMAALANTLADALHAVGDSSASHAALVTAVELFSELSTDSDDPWSPEVWFLSEW